MSAVTVLCEDKGYRRIVDLNAETYRFDVENAHHMKYKDKTLYLSFSPALETENGPLSSIFFKSFFIVSGQITVILFHKQWSFPFKADTEIRIREISISDRFPEILNEPVGHNQCIINMFVGNESNQLSYADTISCLVRDIDTSIRRHLTKYLTLTKQQLVADDFEMSLTGSENPYVPINKFGSLLRSKQLVMTFDFKLIKPIIFSVGSNVRKVRYLPRRPKLLLSWALDNLNSDDGSPQEALKRRLIRNANNRAVPVDLLESIDGLNVTADHCPRAGLPLGSWESHHRMVREEVLILHMLKRCIDDLSPPISEATLRLRFWDNFVYILIGRKDSVISELNIQSLIRSRTPVKVDIAAVLPKINHSSGKAKATRLPILIIELCKDYNVIGFSHKDQEKIISSLSLIGMELVEEFKSRGLDPLTVRVFGLLIGSTEFQFCVAVPEMVYNEDLGINEIHFNVSINPHWNFDIRGGINDDLNCNDFCCSNVGKTVTLKPASIPFSLDQVEPTCTDVTVKEELEEDSNEEDSSTDKDSDDIYYGEVPNANQESNPEESATATTTEATSTTPTETVDIKSVCMLIAFFECVKYHIDLFSQLLLGPVIQESGIPRIPPLTSKSPSSSAAPTPKKEQVRKNSSNTPLNTSASKNDSKGSGDEADNDDSDEKSPVKRTKKRPSREFEVYQAIPSPYKHFFPILYDFKTGKGHDGSEVYILEMERLQPFILDVGGYSPFIRQDKFDEFILDAGTFAVHVLFDLLLLHEKAGFVHRDVSPNNIMFSPQFKIWKLIDFEQSVSVEESWELKRKGGTVGFVAPESLESHIFTPASDVYALGAVLEKYFCPYLLQDVQSKRDRRLFEAFEALVKEMVQPNPELRVPIRVALNCFLCFVTENAIKGFELYGADLIFPLAKIEANSRPAKPSKVPSIATTALPAKRQMELEGSEKEILQSQPPQIQ